MFVLSYPERGSIESIKSYKIFLLQSIGGNEYGKTGHSKIFFYFFEVLLNPFEARFFFLRAAISHHITDTDNT